MSQEENQVINGRGRNEDKEECLFAANIRSVDFSIILRAFFLAAFHIVELMFLKDLKGWGDFPIICLKLSLINLAKLILEQYSSVLSVPGFIITLIKYTFAVDKLRELNRKI